MVIDAINAGYDPGTIKYFTFDDLDHDVIISTHSIPFTYLLEFFSINLYQKSLQFLGIGVQIKTSKFDIENISPPVFRSVKKLGNFFQELYINNLLSQ